MCHLILHAGYAAEVLGILDLYIDARFSQGQTIAMTRWLRGNGESDEEIRRVLGLQQRRPFVANPRYLAGLTGFVTSREPVDARVSHALRLMYRSETNAPVPHLIKSVVRCTVDTKLR